MLKHIDTVKAAWLLCALCIACGDDGTERLSTCPDARIVTDKMGIIRCAGPKKPEENATSTDGKPAASEQRSSTQANRAGQAEADAKTPAANGGSSTPARGSAGEPAADSGERPPADNAGSGTPAPSGGSWYCVQVMNACSCVMGAVASDTCDEPKPTCCVRVENAAAVHTCVCYPEGSAECTGVKSEPSIYPPVAECPPK